jgi:hypothetical protein
MTAPELHRPLAADRVGPDGLDATVHATAAECAALADRMGIPAVRALDCRFRLTRVSGDSIAAAGHLYARLVQTCVLTAEDFETAVEERFAVRFVPAGQESDDPDPEAVDEIPFAGGMLDLGEAAAEQLGLALDPYPRMPGAELPAAAEEEQPHPFAGLGRRQGT